MSGMGGGNLYVSSWGWDDGGRSWEPWRRWSISWKNERKFFITVPPEVTIETVMFMAMAIIEGDGNASGNVRDDLGVLL